MLFDEAVYTRLVFSLEFHQLCIGYTEGRTKRHVPFLGGQNSAIYMKWQSLI
jgi:hypothetical protein